MNQLPQLDTITVQPYHWEYVEGREEGDRRMVRCWSLDRDSTCCMLRIENFPIVCAIELPRTNNRKYIQWNSAKVGELHRKLKSTVKNADDIYSFRKEHYATRVPLYELRLPNGENVVEELRRGNVGKVPVLYVYMKSKKTMYELASAATNMTFFVERVGKITVTPWECEIDPITKLLAFRGSRRCNWISVTSMRIETEGFKVTTGTKEYIADWNTITKIDDDVCKSWNVAPGILSFDIECYSPNYNKFPNMWDPNCHMYMITCNYKRGKEQTKTRMILMGDCNDFEVEGMDLTIVRVKTETELVEEFAKAVHLFNPEILTGFRIQSFDLEYMDARLAMDASDWPVIGKIKDQNASIEREDKQSGAYGFNKMYKLAADGRVVLDAYQYFRREFKYPEYNLNYISSKILKDKKHDIPAAEQFRIYDLMRKGLTFPKGSEEYELGMSEMTRQAKYCVQDAQLVLRLLDNTNLWISMIEMCNVVCVNPYDLYTRGQQIRCMNQLYEACYLRGIILTKRPLDDIPFSGGKVQHPITEKCKVGTMDFNSLYPSIMIANNICYTTYIPESKRMYIPREMCNICYVDCNAGTVKKSEDDDDDSDDEGGTDFKSNVGKAGKYEFWFIKAEFVKGVLPDLVGKLIQSRRDVQALMKTIGYDVVLDKRQNAYKISANSFFGFTGVRNNGMRPFIPLAVSITAWGRQYITETTDYVVKHWNGRIIYGDTDSCMIHLPWLTDDTKLWETLVKMCQEVSNLFPDAIVMKPEYIGVILPIMPKKYCIMKLDPKTGKPMLDDNGEPELEVKGMLSARRDNCRWARDTFFWVLNSIMKDASYMEVIEYLADRITMMFSGQVSHTEMLLNRSISTYSNDSTYFMKIFSDRIKLMGKQIEPGERVYYLVAETEDPKTRLGDRLMLEETYLQSLDDFEKGICKSRLKIDYMYYISKVLTKHVDDVMRVAYPKHTDYLRNINFERGRKSAISLSTPVKFLSHVIGSGVSTDYTLSKIREFVTPFNADAYVTWNDRMNQMWRDQQQVTV